MTRSAYIIKAVRDALGTQTNWDVSDFDPRDITNKVGTWVFPFIYDQRFLSYTENHIPFEGVARVTVVVRSSDEDYGTLCEWVEECIDGLAPIAPNVQTGTGILYTHTIDSITIRGFGGHIESQSGVHTFVDVEVHFTQRRTQ